MDKKLVFDEPSPATIHSGNLNRGALSSGNVLWQKFPSACT